MQARTSYVLSNFEGDTSEHVINTQDTTGPSVQHRQVCQLHIPALEVAS